MCDVFCLLLRFGFALLFAFFGFVFAFCFFCWLCFCIFICFFFLTFFLTKNYLMVGHVWLPSPNTNLDSQGCLQTTLSVVLVVCVCVYVCYTLKYLGFVMVCPITCDSQVSQVTRHATWAIIHWALVDPPCLLCGICAICRSQPRPLGAHLTSENTPDNDTNLEPGK